MGDHLHRLLQGDGRSGAHRPQAALLQESGAQRQAADARGRGGCGESVGNLHDYEILEAHQPVGTGP